MQGTPSGQRTCGRCPLVGSHTFLRPITGNRRAQTSHRTRYPSCICCCWSKLRHMPADQDTARQTFLWLEYVVLSTDCRSATGATGRPVTTSTRAGSSLQADLQQLGKRVATAAGALGLSLLLSLTPLLQPVQEAQAITNEQLVFLEVCSFIKYPRSDCRWESVMPPGVLKRVLSRLGSVAPTATLTMHTHCAAMWTAQSACSGGHTGGCSCWALFATRKHQIHIACAPQLVNITPDQSLVGTTTQLYTGYHHLLHSLRYRIRRLCLWMLQSTAEIP